MDIHQITRKNATCQDLISCLYNLKPTDIETLQQIAKNPNSTLDTISAEIHRDRSSVHRCIAKLLAANLVTKETKTIKGGGYYHTYSMVESDKIRKYAKERVDEIIKSLQALVESFDSDLQKHLEN